MNEKELQTKLDEMGAEFAVPGIAVGIYHQGQELYAFHGVTSIENPLPVDENTLFQYGSTHKTFTATAIMRLVEQDKVDLDATVRTYIPELKLKDEECAANVKVLQLLNHTAGWTGDAPEDCGDGDDARARFVASMIDFEQVTPLGTAVSYNNASLNVAGRIIEKITGQTYEKAINELLYQPLGLESTFFFPNDVMSRRFVVGHAQNQEDGTIKVARPWSLARAGAPAGGFGVSANAGDQIKWARFHLGDGTAPDGTRLLSKESLDLMKQPTVECPGSAIGDAVGISWLLEDAGDVRLVGHGGTTIGQYSEFLMSPENDWALISMTNCGPNGSQFNRAFQRWALEAMLGIKVSDEEPVSLGDAALAEYAGTYETINVWARITTENGALVLNVEIKPEVKERMRAEGEDVDEEQPPIPIGMLSGRGDRYVITDGAAKGMKGYFMRGPKGEVSGVHIGGRLATRAHAPVPA